MLFGSDREQMRRFFIASWNKHLASQTMEPLEQVIAKVVELHPEYHKLLEDSDAATGKEYLAEDGQTNPFLHMGMHIAIHEQMSTQRPAGIMDVYQKLLLKLGNPHEVEHRMMGCLSEIMWQAQQNNQMPDEQAYLRCVQELADRH